MPSSKNYLKQGFKEKEAESTSVEKALDSAEKERADIVAQIKTQLSEYFKEPEVAKEDFKGKGIEKPTPKVEKKKAETVPEAKEPWEMTLDEFEKAGHRPSDVTKRQWVDIMRHHMKSLGQSEKAGTRAVPYSDYENYHKSDVQQALSEGKPIPPEVLAEYPELTEKAKKKFIHDYSSTQVDLPEAPASAIKNFANKIPDSELYIDPKDPSYGREDKPHITVRYGLETINPKDIAPAFEGMGPIKVKLGKVSIFESDDKYDVIKIDIESPDLQEANKRVGEAVPLPGETHKDYKPHATIAYVKKGEGKKYVGDTSLEGQEIVIDNITLSGKDGKLHKIPLTEKAKPSPDLPTTILTAAREVESDDSMLRAFSEMRAKIPEVSKADFDKTILDMAKEGRIHPHIHAYPAEAHMPDMVVKGEDVYMGMVIRGKEEERVSVKPEKEPKPEAEESLIQEAKKHDSAEEFVEEQKKDIQKTLRNLQEEYGDDVFIRIVPKGKSYEVGDIVEDSYVWEYDGTDFTKWTKDKAEGASALDLRAPPKEIDSLTKLSDKPVSGKILYKVKYADRTEGEKFFSAKLSDQDIIKQNRTKIKNINITDWKLLDRYSGEQGVIITGNRVVGGEWNVDLAEVVVEKGEVLATFETKSRLTDIWNKAQGKKPKPEAEEKVEEKKALVKPEKEPTPFDKAKVEAQKKVDKLGAEYKHVYLGEDTEAMRRAIKRVAKKYDVSYDDLRKEVLWEPVEKKEVEQEKVKVKVKEEITPKRTKAKQNSIDRLDRALSVIEEEAPKEIKRESIKRRKWIDNAWDTINTHGHKLGIKTLKRTTFYDPKDDLSKISEIRKELEYIAPELRKEPAPPAPAEEKIEKPAPARVRIDGKARHFTHYIPLKGEKNKGKARIVYGKGEYAKIATVEIKNIDNIESATIVKTLKELRQIKKGLKEGEELDIRAQFEAWHGQTKAGEPITEFDPEMIGTGAGLALGWGVYLSEKEGVGRYYAEMGGKSQQQRFNELTDKRALEIVDMAAGDLSNIGMGKILDADVITEIDNTIFENKNDRLQDNTVKLILDNKELFSKPPRNLYEVSLGKDLDDMVWLEWDENISPAVAMKIGKQLKKEAINIKRYYRKGYNTKDPQGLAYAMGRGNLFYQGLEKHFKTARKASEFLSRAGIDGVKAPVGYFGGKADTGKFNYVIFDPSKIKIKEYIRFDIKKKAKPKGVPKYTILKVLEPFIRKMNARGLPIKVTVVKNKEELTYKQLQCFRKNERLMKAVEGNLTMKRVEGKITDIKVRGVLLAPKMPKKGDKVEVMMFADAFSSPEEVLVNFFHEVRGHFSLRQAFGTRLNSFLDEVYQELRKKKELPELQKLYGVESLEKKKDQRLMAEEYLARIAETGENPGLISKLIAKIREILKKMGVSLKLSDNDIRNIVADSVRLALSGKIKEVVSISEDMVAQIVSIERPDGKPFFRAVAVRGDDGTIYKGKTGEIHVNVLERLPFSNKQNVSLEDHGFVTSEGDFYTRGESFQLLRTGESKALTRRGLMEKEGEAADIRAMYVGEKARTADKMALSRAAKIYENKSFLTETERAQLKEYRDRGLKTALNRYSKKKDTLTPSEQKEYGRLADLSDKASTDEKLRESIRQETGWILGMDDMWRFEIDDSKVSVKELKPLYQEDLEDIISHPELFKAYPALRKIKVYPHKDTGSAFAPLDNTISLSIQGSKGQIKEALLHEIQHAVQEIAGFARGGSPEGIRAVDPVRFDKIYKAHYEHNLDNWKAQNPGAKDIPDALKGDIVEATKMEAYRMLAGEIEARDTADRMVLTPAGRKMEKPYFRQGIPKEQAIVRFETEGAAMDIRADIIDTKGIPSSIKSKIGIKGDKLSERANAAFKDIKENWVTRFFDRLHPIKALSNVAYMLHRLETGIQVPISMLMNHGKLEWEGKALIVNTRGKGFFPFLNSLGEDAEKLFYWVAAKRAEVLEGEGRERWLTKDIRKDIVEWTGKTDKHWNKLNDKFQEFNKSVLDLAEKAGIIDPVLRKTWEQDYYVPFYRVFEDENTKEEFLKGPYRNKQHIDAQIRRLMGAEKKIGDLTANIIKNWSHLIHESVRNLARKEAFEAAIKYGKNTGLIDEKGAQIPIIQKVEKKELLNILGSKTDVKWATIREGAKQAAAVFDTKEEAEAWAYHLEDKNNKKYKVDKRKTVSIMFGQAKDHNILSFRKNGKPIYFRVNDPELFNALSNMNNEKFNNFIMKAFSTTKYWLTYGATFGPAFRVANMLRDTLHTAVISKSFVPFLDSFKGFVKALKEDQDWIKVAAGGGTFGGSYVKAEDAKALSKYIDKIVKKEGKGAIDRILDTPKKMLAFWDKIGAASEDAARVSLYTRRRTEGVSHLEAAFEARDLLDFTMRGDAAAIQFLTQSIAFMNARMQGLYKLGRAVHQNPKSFALKGGAIALATMILWAINKDKDEWDELEDWDKRTYYHFWVGDKHFRIPKPFEVGAIFSSLFEATADTMTGNEEFNYFMDFVLATFRDTFAVNPVPQMIRPLAEQWANKSFFTGRLIEGMAMKKLKPGERKTPWTSETMQLAGKLGIPPKRAEELVRGYFATFGMFLLGMSDVAIRQFADFPHKPKRTIEEYPLVGRFIRRKAPPRHSKHITRFYEIFKDIDEINATVNNYRRLGDYRAAKKLALKHKKKLQLKKGVNRAQRFLSAINRQIKKVMADRTMKPDAKRKRVDDLIKRRNLAAKNIYTYYKDL